IFYEELRRIAAAQMRGERVGHTLQATALVAELYFKLIQQKGLPEPSSATEERLRTTQDFLGLARYLMAQILIEHGRAKRAWKRRHIRVELDEARAVSQELGDYHQDILL